MSHKVFYQTFFQTEQLFRRADDGLTFPAVPSPTGVGGALETAMRYAADIESVQQEPVSAPAVQISDPVLPPVEQPVLAVDVVDEPEPAVVANVPDADPIATEAEPAPMAPAFTPEPPQVRRPATPLISQKVLILVDEDLQPGDLLFLEKILKAVHLDVEGVDLLNVHGTKNVNFQELLSGKLIHHFFTFGVPFSRLNLDIMMDRYQPVRFEGITFLMADTLPAIEADVVLKKKLWESLKKVFLWR